MSRVYLVKGAENVLIDTGLPFNFKGILRDLERFGAPIESIRHLLLTHHDIDHIGNAAALAKVSGAAVWAPAQDIPYITGEKERPGVKKTFSRIFHVKIPQELRPITSGAVVCGIQAIHTPGHTPGHTCYVYNNVLFAGDLLNSSRHGIIPNTIMNLDFERLQQSAREVYHYPFDWVCPAHSAPCRAKRKAPDRAN
jgi:glyoxylase-like metal-dependent hydrolase (beta-lactamase superfamily II)